MPNYRTFALAVIMTGTSAASAAAQDCDRFAYGCRGAPGYAQPVQPQPGYPQPPPGYAQPQPGYAQPQQGYAQPQPGYAQPQQGYSQPQPGYGYQGYPRYQQAYPGYQTYPGYQAARPYYGAPSPYESPYGSPSPYEQGYGSRQYAYPPDEPQRAAPSAARPSENALNPAYRSDPALARRFASLYGPGSGEAHALPTVRMADLDPAFVRMTVSYRTGEAPGTIIIDPQNHYLYLVQEGGLAIRYGVGVGRQGFGWSGTANVHDKQQWPDWYPPKEMLARQPELMANMSELQGGLGMPGGTRNPLGARALYLWQGNKDTLYRIHGTSEPWTIGRSVSSGCIRMIDQDVIDLYERVPVGAKVIVLGSGGVG
jgi:lipoprotein-anchoring transpeptidase ErfK/SrfK